ncbi:MAG: helix-turn-helix domain-containing protein [Gemmatimonadota bacterium]|nr:helix-turn-helix domain-containing protein [Gemmatimonadota bacterium]
MSTTLARRIFLAHLELSYNVGRKVTLAEFGELVAKHLGRETPFSAAAVSRWEAGSQVPSADVIEAIAAVTGTDPGWISHGDRSAAPPPPRLTSSKGVVAQSIEPRHGALTADQASSEQELTEAQTESKPRRLAE